MSFVDEGIEDAVESLLRTPLPNECIAHRLFRHGPRVLPDTAAPQRSS